MPVIAQPKIVTITAEECCECGVVFGLSSDYRKQRIDDRQRFSCPNGHWQSYTRDQLSVARDELARTKAKLDQETARVATLRDNLIAAQNESAHKDRRINGYKGAVARVKRRVSNGRCPCCSAQFKDLKTHMKAEHPDWNPDRGAEALGAKS